MADTTKLSADAGAGESLVSAANLLIVAVMKLNRVIVPALLRWQRSSRQNWILRAAQDVVADVRKNPGLRMLCVADCCLDTYADRSMHIDIDLDHLDLNLTQHLRRNVDRAAPAAPDEDTTGSPGITPSQSAMPPVPTSTSASRHADVDASGDAANTVALLGGGGDGSASGTLSEARHLRLLVMQEERHRQLTVKPLVYRSVLLTAFSLLSVVVYCAVVIAVVLILNDMSPRQTVVFIFSLVATAVVSDADMLMAAMRQKPPRRASDDDDPLTTRPVRDASNRSGTPGDDPVRPPIVEDFDDV